MVDFIFLVIYIAKIVAWKYTNDYGKNTAMSEKVVGIRRSHSSSVFETVPIGCGWRVVGHNRSKLFFFHFTKIRKILPNSWSLVQLREIFGFQTICKTGISRTWGAGSLPSWTIIFGLALLFFISCKFFKAFSYNTFILKIHFSDWDWMKPLAGREPVWTGISWT